MIVTSGTAIMMFLLLVMHQIGHAEAKLDKGGDTEQFFAQVVFGRFTNSHTSALSHCKISFRTKDKKMCNQNLLPFFWKQYQHCTIRCANDFSRRIADMGIGMSDGANGFSVNKKLYNEKDFKTFCGIYEDLSSCFTRCPMSRFKDVMEIGFSALKYICITHYSEFLHFLPCYKKAEANVTEVCSPKCRTWEIPGIQVNMNQAKQFSNAAMMKEGMTSICKIMSCQFGCQEPVLLEVCGDTEPARFLRDYVQVAFDPVERMLKNDGFWPEECSVAVQGKAKLRKTEMRQDPIPNETTDPEEMPHTLLKTPSKTYASSSTISNTNDSILTLICIFCYAILEWTFLQAGV